MPLYLTFCYKNVYSIGKNPNRSILFSENYGLDFLLAKAAKAKVE